VIYVVYLLALNGKSKYVDISIILMFKILWTVKKMADLFSNDAMLEMFLFEASQLLEQLEQVVLSCETRQHYSEEDINEIFRIMHTIKGSSSMMMFNGIAALSHAIEDLFSYIRKEKPEKYFSSDLNDLILTCIDFIKIELEKIRNKDNVDGDPSELVEKIKSFLAQLKERGFNVPEEKNEEVINYFKAVLYFEDGCEMENIRAFAVVHNLEKIAYKLVYYPADIIENEKSVETIRREGFQIFIKTDRSKEEIQEQLVQTVFLRKLQLTVVDEKAFAESLQDRENGELVLSENSVKKQEENATAETEDGGKTAQVEKSHTETEQKQNVGDHHSTSSAQSYISVSVAKLDRLMDLVGEMVIAEAMVIQNPDLQGLELANFHKAATQLSKITSEIQDIVMSVRMVPLAATFQRMNRIVRDMCRKLNKEVQLEIIGEETEVDKNIIERITDPLMHLVRNAVDHGIETAEEREAMGKGRVGKITIEAKNVGSDVHIIVKDDGRGLNKEKILKKARENNLLTTDEDSLSDSEIYRLILLPGFSTSDKVTEFSGRGVGMDVVAKNIEAIGGSISIESEKNKGTQITLAIPLTLAIIDGMNIQVGKSTFTIPTISIQESFRPRDEKVIVDPDGNEMIMVRGECYPVLRLHKFFGIETEVTNISDGIIIMISQDERNICVFADRLLGQQQVVVKSLPEYIKRFKKISGISGCTLLGDGSISLILDIANLVHNK
jgi:two-component system chemotaxis sensor kinase CheA